MEAKAEINLLTKQELNVGSQLLKGKTSQEIAYVLNCSARAIAYFKQNLRSKLNCINDCQLGVKLNQIINLDYATSR
jgi:DNA-binding NarL/FixJ family response regulator